MGENICENLLNQKPNVNKLFLWYDRKNCYIVDWKVDWLFNKNIRKLIDKKVSIFVSLIIFPKFVEK